ncbi:MULTISPECIES: hypothetical protein [Enterococcus]|uniref:Uncharacterized protein n=1 Tax=Candidatus Enterococcus mangumiae TaxID=2230878 RepID=A0ABZ2SYG4_9ENTE|nr:MULTISPECIES: hypothetical protein [unclassified Enterococcus]MBO0462122.1 hypothetical protein [Enterococcus sp. DIV1298c]MBO0490600.1 hypothetical protein [Enterococcus sp. DIV1094]MBO1300194.1 hypothetical protein [Enterococcus sp. DIV1271a]
MKRMNKVVGVSHICSIFLSMYLGNNAIQQPVEANALLFPISLTDGVILSIFLFLMVFIGNIFGSFASFFKMSIYPVLSIGLGITGVFAMLFFVKRMDVYTTTFGLLCLVQVMLGLWLSLRSANLMKIR